MSANTALELEDVVFRYQEKGKRNILDHTSLSIPAGTLTVPDGRQRLRQKHAGRGSRRAVPGKTVVFWRAEPSGCTGRT